MPIREQLSNSFRERAKTAEFWQNLSPFFFLSLAFWPITRWFAATAHEQSRIFNALIVLLVATVLLVRFDAIKIEDPLRLNRLSRYALFLAYSLLLGGLLIKSLPALIEVSPTLLQLTGLISIPAYCFGLASFILFVFGENAKRITFTVTGTLCLFLFLSLLMDPLDWPLRALAGQWSSTALSIIGKSVEMGLVTDQINPPRLMLLVEGQPFHVASECNGFGVIITSLLLALLLSIYRRQKPVHFLFNLIVGLLLGFFFNTLRIVIIVLLAPGMMDHYHLMHEIVGALTYWGCLAVVWFQLRGPVHDENTPAAEHS